MRHCNHKSWLSFHETQPVMFRHTSTLTDIVMGLDAPAKRFPSLVVMLGDVGNAILSTRRRSGFQEQPGLSLQIDPETAFSDHPTLFASGNFSKQIRFTPISTEATCHRHTIRELQWQAASPAQTVDNLYSRLVHPFADLICLFIPELETIPRILDKMLPWLEQSHSGNSLHTFHPHLLVILSSGESRSAAEVESQLRQLLRHRFRNVSIDHFLYISIHVRDHSNQNLRDRIKREADRARSVRAQHHALLNAVHFDHLFRHACDHFANTEKVSFNMITASRLNRPVPIGLHVQVADLLTKIDTYTELTAFAAPFIAGCFTLDNYAYDVPCWFFPLIHK